ncbi:MAG: class I SAM-dependent methyltransferase [Proteobacteria bacterium]|nr:class I SAM-dependent methyltransferase [Pseudomonadota bacterium]
MVMDEPARFARIFGIPPDLVPFLPELLGDLWSLGLPPDMVAALLRPFHLPGEKTRVLDLGCGKGAAAVCLAGDSGFRVTGVDLFPPFIEEARMRAKEKGVGRLCRFIEEDILEYVKRPRRFDVAILISTGGVFGGLAESVTALRGQVVPEGLMVVGEGYRKEGALPSSLLENCCGREEAYARLTSRGDAILAEKTVAEDRTAAQYRDYILALERGTNRICLHHPELEPLLREHLTAQERMCGVLKSSFVPALWLIRKKPAV